MKWQVLLFAALLLSGQSQAQSQPEPYVESYYNDSYQVFVGAGNLVRARQVIDNALYWRPDDVRWWERLAQVSRWQGDAQTSLKAWRKVAELSDSRQAWDEVMQLAPAVYDNRVMLEAYQKSLRDSPRDAALIEKIAREYELLGQPDEGVTFFRDWNRRYPSRPALRQMMLLSLNQGADQQAARYARNYMDRYGPQHDMALHASRIQWLHGQRDAALDNLEKDAKGLDYSPLITRQLAVMAAEQGRWDLAQANYERLIAHDDDTIPDLYTYINLIRYRDRDEMVALMSRAWRKLEDPALAVGVLYALQERGDNIGVQVFLDQLSGEQRQTLEQYPPFMQFQAAFQQRNNRHNEARRSLQQALVLAPDDRESRISWLWLHVAAGNKEILSRSLRAWEDEARRSSSYWEAYAAGYLLLGDSETAVRYQKALLQRSPRDWTRQWQYAQTLIAAGRSDEAWPLLRHLWENQPERVEKDQASEYIYMIQALSQYFENGDASLNRANAVANASGQLDDAEKAEWLAQWSQLQTSQELALGWYLRKLQANGELQGGTALAYASLEYDMDGVARARDRYGMRLSRQEKLDVELQLDEPAMAAATYALLQHQAPELAGRYNEQEELLLPLSRSSQLDAGVQRIGALDIEEWLFTQYQPAGRFSQFAVQLNQRRFSSNDETLLIIDEDETRIGAFWNYRRARYQHEFYVGQRTLLENEENMAALQMTAAVLRDWSLGLQYQWRMPSDESSLLILGASRTGHKLALDWNPTRTWQNRVDLADYQYHDLNDEVLGDGRILNIETTWRPWWSRFSPGIRVLHTRADFTEERLSMGDVREFIPRGESAAAIPQDYDQTEVMLLLGSADIHIRPHRLQAWAEIGYSENSLFEDGVNGRLGIEGPLIGRDAWKLLLERQLNTGGSDEDSYRAALEYRIYY